MNSLGYTPSQRRNFVVLTLLNGFAAWVLVTYAHPAAVSIVLYALALPPVFHLVILADRALDPRYVAAAARVFVAMRRREIVFEYQPIVSISDGRPLAAEALARWSHPREGTLAPARWLPATEGWLERRFNRYTLRQAIEQAAAWREEGRPLIVCINVTPRALSDSSLPDFVAKLLEESHVPATDLTIEITEAILDTSPLIADVARRLTDLGVSLALDDFGIGHSAMERLVALPITALKVDRRFVSEFPEGRPATVVRAAVGLCHELDMSCVAEGVETPAAMDALRAIGCDFAQGYFVCRPVSPTALAAWLESDRDYLTATHQAEIERRFIRRRTSDREAIP